MRVLALSDIHDLVQPVEALCRLETGSFDAVVVAGDIGVSNGGAILHLLKERFASPVLYVLGNWDYDPSCLRDHGPGIHHLHCEAHTFGGITFCGLDYPVSGRPANAGRSELAAITARYDPRRTVVVSHERLPKTAEDMPGVRLHLFGHHHHFEDRTYKGSRFINVSALGEFTSVRPAGSRLGTFESIRNVGHGSYVTLSLDVSGEVVEVERAALRQTQAGWVALDDRKWSGRPLIDAPWVLAS